VADAGARRCGRNTAPRRACLVELKDEREARRPHRQRSPAEPALAAGRHGDAVALFMAYVGTPAEQIDGMRQQDFWPAMAALGPTLAYDHTAILGPDAAVPAGRAARLSVPALVMYGTASYPFMAETARSLQRAIPQAELRALKGQGHDVSPATLASVLLEFLT
jgi:pimeloyl-ACP methyl ester carboxylesterase